MSNFQPLEVVDRSRETQPQAVENLNKITQQDKRLNVQDNNVLRLQFCQKHAKETQEKWELLSCHEQLHV